MLYLKLLITKKLWYHVLILVAISNYYHRLMIWEGFHLKIQKNRLQNKLNIKFLNSKSNKNMNHIGMSYFCIIQDFQSNIRVRVPLYINHKLRCPFFRKLIV